MAFHEDFWLAAAAVGPLIVLAEAVTLSRYLRWSDTITAALEASRLRALKAVEAREARLTEIASAGTSETALADLRTTLEELARVLEEFGNAGSARAQPLIAFRSTILLRTALAAASCSVAATVLALFSLAWWRNLVEPTLIVVALFVAMMLLLGQAILEAAVQRQAKDDEPTVDLPS